jgi:hypothetical protein
VESQPFTISPIANALSTGITNASIGDLTYSMSSDGTVTWGLEYVQWTLPAASTDTNAWSSQLTVQKVNSLGQAAPDYEGQERPVIEDSRMGQTVSYPIAYWTIPEANSAYRTYRFRLYLYSRNNVKVLQTTCWSGGDHVDVVPVAQYPNPPALPTSVSASENASYRYSDINSQVYTPITVQVTLPTGSNALWLNVWITNYTGTGWDWAGKWNVDDVISFDRLAPSQTTQWYVKVATGNYVAERSPERP